MFTLFRKAPLIPVAILFTTGILATSYLEEKQVERIGLCVLFTGSAEWFFRKKINEELHAFIQSVCMWIFIFLTGYTISFLQHSIPNNHISRISGTIKGWGIVIRDEQVSKGKTSAWIEMRAIKTSDGNWKEISGNAIAYFSGKNLKFSIQGDSIFFEGRIRALSDVEQTPYIRYLQINNLSSVLVGIKTYVGGREQSLSTYVYECRKFLSRRIQSHFYFPSTSALGTALLLGDKNELNPELKASYTASGASHILAVSGMHVSLLLLFLSKTFGLLPLQRIKRLYTVCMILLLLFFGLLAGASPSVMRAVYMGIAALLIRMTHRKMEILNTIALAWIFQIGQQVTVVYDVGFQLSYAAVVGIVLVNPLLTQRIHTSKKWLLYIRDLFTVSIAAQTFTIPIVLYNFGIFPTYFLLTNLLAIPISSLGTLLGFLFLTISWIPYLNAGLGWLSSVVLYAMNSIVEQIAKLPHPTIFHLQISASTAFLIGIGAVVFIAWLLRRFSVEEENWLWL